ncbi:MAG: nucleoside phosphorylase [Candidatus Dormibacteria bacterium]
MGYPNFSGKHELAPFFTPVEYQEYLLKSYGWEGLPPLAGVVLTFQASFFREVVAGDGWQRLEAPRSAVGDFYVLSGPQGAVGISGAFGVGAPAATNRLEDIGGSGCSRFIAIGYAGTLQPDLEVGDIVLCDRAIRDEGVSHHYASPAKYAKPSATLTAALDAQFDALEIAHRTGTTWTIDTPYRETVEEIRRYREEGTLTVEMEAAALATVAEYRRFEFATAFVVSDGLADPEWRPQFHHDAASQGLHRLLGAAISTLTTTTS